MRSVILLLICAMVPISVAEAGAIAHMFEAGYDLVPWGTSLEDLVAGHAGGDHFFATGTGNRDYFLLDEKTMFGIARPRMRVHYFLDDTNSVTSVALTFPYPQRQKLLGMLTLSFGPYQRTFSKGVSTYYVWKRDDGIEIDLRDTLDPTYGILSLGISGPNSELAKHAQPDCAKTSAKSGK